jgi:hypothetical protein
MTTQDKTSMQGFEQAVIEVLKKTASEEAEKVIAEAVSDFEKRLRREVATVVMSASSYYQVDRRENHLVITVKA